MTVSLDPERRLTWAAQTENQRRVYVYLLERAVNVVQDTASTATDISFAQYVMTGKGDMETIAIVLANEATTIGTRIDDVNNEGLVVTNFNIAYAINDLNFFNVLAAAWTAGGMLD